MSTYLNKCSILIARYMMRGRTETTFVCVRQKGVGERIKSQKKLI